MNKTVKKKIRGGYKWKVRKGERMDMQDILGHDSALFEGRSDKYVHRPTGRSWWKYTTGDLTPQIWTNGEKVKGKVEWLSLERRELFSSCEIRAEEGRVWKGNAGSERKAGGEKEVWASGEDTARWTSSGRPLRGRMKEPPRDAWVYQVARGNKEVSFLASLLSALGGLFSVVNW